MAIVVRGERFQSMKLVPRSHPIPFPLTRRGEDKVAVKGEILLVTLFPCPLITLSQREMLNP